MLVAVRGRPGAGLLDIAMLTIAREDGTTRFPTARDARTALLAVPEAQTREVPGRHRHPMPLENSVQPM
jgi:hypothetical protein